MPWRGIFGWKNFVHSNKVPMAGPSTLELLRDQLTVMVLRRVCEDGRVSAVSSRAWSMAAKATTRATS
jgi:hypothetical protein